MAEQGYDEDGYPSDEDLEEEEQKAGDPQAFISDQDRRIINNYELINYIGEGAFGQVYLCEHI